MENSRPRRIVWLVAIALLAASGCASRPDTVEPNAAHPTSEEAAEQSATPGEQGPIDAEPDEATAGEERGEEARPPRNGFVSPPTAASAAANGALLLDARGQAAFLLSHPEGAVHIAWDDFSDPNQRGLLHPDLAHLAAGLGALGVEADRATYVIGGWDSNWGEEARIYWMLARLGVRDVFVVSGGVAAWNEAGLPTARGRSAGVAREFEPTPEPSVEFTLDQIASTDALIIDVRTAREFEGATPYGETRGGHMPGAVNLEWTSFLTEEGALRSPEEIRALVGAPLDREVATYCTGGVRSAFVWAALEYAGYQRATNFAGSWWQYAASELPAE